MTNWLITIPIINQRVYTPSLFSIFLTSQLSYSVQFPKTVLYLVFVSVFGKWYDIN